MGKWRKRIQKTQYKPSTNNAKHIIQEFKEIKGYITQQMNQMKTDVSEFKHTMEQIKSTLGSHKYRMNEAEERT